MKKGVKIALVVFVIFFVLIFIIKNFLAYYNKKVVVYYDKVGNYSCFLSEVSTIYIYSDRSYTYENDGNEKSGKIGWIDYLKLICNKTIIEIKNKDIMKDERVDSYSRTDDLGLINYNLITYSERYIYSDKSNKWINLNEIDSDNDKKDVLKLIGKIKRKI